MLELIATISECLAVIAVTIALPLMLRSHNKTLEASLPPKYRSTYKK